MSATAARGAEQGGVRVALEAELPRDFGDVAIASLIVRNVRLRSTVADGESLRVLLVMASKATGARIRKSPGPVR